MGFFMLTVANHFPDQGTCPLLRLYMVPTERSGDNDA